MARNRAAGVDGRRCARHDTRQRTARARYGYRDDEAWRRCERERAAARLAVRGSASLGARGAH